MVLPFPFAVASWLTVNPSESKETKTPVSFASAPLVLGNNVKAPPLALSQIAQFLAASLAFFIITHDGANPKPVIALLLVASPT